MQNGVARRWFYNLLGKNRYSEIWLIIGRGTITTNMTITQQPDFLT